MSFKMLAIIAGQHQIYTRLASRHDELIPVCILICMNYYEIRASDFDKALAKLV